MAQLAEAPWLVLRAAGAHLCAEFCQKSHSSVGPAVHCEGLWDTAGAWGWEDVQAQASLPEPQHRSCHGCGSWWGAQSAAGERHPGLAHSFWELYGTDLGSRGIRRCKGSTGIGQQVCLAVLCASPALFCISSSVPRWGSPAALSGSLSTSSWSLGLRGHLALVQDHSCPQLMVVSSLPDWCWHQAAPH